MKLCGKFYKRVLTNEIIFGSIYIIYQLCDKKKGEDSRISTPKIWIDLYSHNTRVHPVWKLSSVPTLKVSSTCNQNIVKAPVEVGQATMYKKQNDLSQNNWQHRSI